MGNTADDDDGIFFKINLHISSKHITFGAYFKPIENMETTIIEDSSPQAKQFAAHVRKTAVVTSYPLALFSHVAKNPYLFIIGCAFLYVILILLINILFDWNYGYIGNQTPDSTTILDTLRGWPQRLIWMFAIIFTIQFIMYLPWKLFGGKKQ